MITVKKKDPVIEVSPLKAVVLLASCDWVLETGYMLGFIRHPGLEGEVILPKTLSGSGKWNVIQINVSSEPGTRLDYFTSIMYVAGKRNLLHIPYFVSGSTLDSG